MGHQVGAYRMCVDRCHARNGCIDDRCLVPRGNPAGRFPRGLVANPEPWISSKPWHSMVAFYCVILLLRVIMQHRSLYERAHTPPARRPTQGLVRATADNK